MWCVSVSKSIYIYLPILEHSKKDAVFVLSLSVYSILANCSCMAVQGLQSQPRIRNELLNLLGIKHLKPKKVALKSTKKNHEL